MWRTEPLRSEPCRAGSSRALSEYPFWGMTRDGISVNMQCITLIVTIKSLVSERKSPPVIVGNDLVVTLEPDSWSDSFG